MRIKLFLPSIPVPAQPPKKPAIFLILWENKECFTKKNEKTCFEIDSINSEFFHRKKSFFIKQPRNISKRGCRLWGNCYLFCGPGVVLYYGSRFCNVHDFLVHEVRDCPTRAQDIKHRANSNWKLLFTIYSYFFFGVLIFNAIFSK